MSSCRHTITRTNGFASGISGVIVLFHRSSLIPAGNLQQIQVCLKFKEMPLQNHGLDYIYIYILFINIYSENCRLDDSELVMGIRNERCLLFFCWARSLGICRMDWIPQRLETLNKGVSGSCERIFALGEVLQHASGSKDGLFVLLLLRSFTTQSMMVSLQTMFGICNS